MLGLSNIPLWSPVVHWTQIILVDAVFSNGFTRLNDLSKEAMLQAIKEQDLRFLQVAIIQ